MTTSKAHWPPITVVPEPGAIVNRVFLCRHGETEANAKGLLQGSGVNNPLNDRGIEQAKALRDQIKDEKFDIIVSSKLARAKETADIIAEYHPLATRLFVEELAEISWGEWDGGSSPHLSELLNDWSHGNYSAKAPIGESPIDVEKRAVPAIYDCLLQNPGKTILFVSTLYIYDNYRLKPVVHGRLLRIILSSIIYRSLEHMNNFTHQNCCINILDVISDTDKSISGKRLRMDPYRILSTHPSNSSVNDAEATYSSKSDIDQMPNLQPSITTKSSISHPENLTFVPIALDDRRHMDTLN